MVEIIICLGEVENGDARLGEKKEPLVGCVEERVAEEAAFCLVYR